jgi:Na+(H+)/acetate symporter ActP
VPKIGATDKNLLLIARLFAIPMTGLACMVAVLAYNPGYLLVVAFDVVLAGCFVPLMAAVYWPSMTPNAGAWLCSVSIFTLWCIGCSARLGHGSLSHGSSRGSGLSPRFEAAWSFTIPLHLSSV